MRLMRPLEHYCRRTSTPTTVEFRTGCQYTQDKEDQHQLVAPWNASASGRC